MNCKIKSELEIMEEVREFNYERGKFEKKQFGLEGSWRV